MAITLDGTLNQIYVTAAAPNITLESAGINTQSRQPAMLAQPDSAGTFAGVAGSTIFGWNTSGSIRFNRGFTISGSTSSPTKSANASNTGRITVPVAGVYSLYFDHRNETTAGGADSGSGQAGVFINGSQVIRRHINQWGNFPYNHMVVCAMLNLNANDYIECGMWWNSGSYIGSPWSGYGDTVNWLYLAKIS